MYEATANCKDIAGAPVTNLEPQCVPLAGYCYTVISARNSVSHQSLATLWCYGTWQRYKHVPIFTLTINNPSSW
jgi:hypothetical protein